MTKNLSFRGEKSTRNFYSSIHASQKENETVAGLPPSVQDIKTWLTKKNATDPEIAAKAALDVGCGMNAYTAAIFCQLGFGSVQAVDLNPEVAEHLVRISADKKIRFTPASVLELPFPNESFDFVNCSGVVHHTPDPEKAISELSRVTKTGGVCFIGVYCFENSLFELVIRIWRLMGRILPFVFLQSLFKKIPALNNFVMDHMYVPILWVYRAQDIRILLKKYGLSVEEEFVTGFDVFYHKKIYPKKISGDGLLRFFACSKINCFK